MTTITEFEKKCAVCGKTSEQKVIMSTSTWGYPDLDLRPAEMQRSSMFAWLDECPHCGYVAANIENELHAPAHILKTDAYLTCEGNDFKSDLAKMFYRRYMISQAENDHDSEFNSLLRCAWTCDDNKDELAIKVRKTALNSIDKVTCKSENEKNNLKLIKADLLRRTGQFDEVIDGFKDVIFEDKMLNDISSFQIDLAMKKDMECHAIEEVVKN